MGDPAGVGPEIIVKACRALAPRVERAELLLVVIGHRAALDAARAVLGDYQADGWDVTGQVPGDTVFVKLRARQFDAVVAMYHDQGHIPVKLLGFEVDPATGAWRGLSGVNVTLGLPIIRTSVDHGTAFDIAGTGQANEESLIEAIDYALLLARGRG